MEPFDPTNPRFTIRGADTVTRTFTAGITQEGDWYIAQCLDVDVASQVETADEALAKLGEALALSFTSPVGTALPDLWPVEVKIGSG